MKELTLETLIAVFEQMFGAWLFWLLVAAAAIVTLAFLFVVVRDRGVRARRLVRAELLFPLGAVAAVIFVFFVTNSRLADIGGPIDWLVLLGIGVVGGGGATLLSYVAQGLIAARRGH